MRDIYYMSGIQAAMCVSTTRFNLKFVYKLITLKLIQKKNILWGSATDMCPQKSNISPTLI